MLKLTQRDDMKVFFTSDFHLNHNPKWIIPIWKSRGYDSVSEMNDSIIKSINDCVRPTDSLFFLGDFVLNCSESQFEEFLSRILSQTIYVIFGNHNSCIWNIYQREVSKKYLELDDGFSNGTVVSNIEVYPFRYRNLIFLGNYLELVVDGHYFVLSHFAISSWHRMSHDAMMIHGHSHGNLKTSLPQETKYGKILDVSWDVFKKPLLVEEILSIMNKKKIISVDHH